MGWSSDGAVQAVSFRVSYLISSRDTFSSLTAFAFPYTIIFLSHPSSHENPDPDLARFPITGRHGEQRGLVSAQTSSSPPVAPRRNEGSLARSTITHSMPILTLAPTPAETDGYSTETSETQYATELHLTRLLDEWRATDQYKVDGAPFVPSSLSF